MKVSGNGFVISTHGLPIFDADDNVPPPNPTFLFLGDFFVTLRAFVVRL